MSEFAGKVVMVTGAASGIGFAVAEHFAESGAKVMCCDINEENLTAAVAKLSKYSGEVEMRCFDVSSAQACAESITSCIERFGALHILCNVAGMILTKRLADFDDDDYERIMAVNVGSVFYLSKYAMPHLAESKGNIVNIASTAGLVGVPYNAPYAASKGAVVQLTKAIAVEYAEAGVRVNVVCPGAVATPLAATVQPPKDCNLALYQRMFPLVAEVAQPAEIASSVAYLASENARFVTGSVLTIDGGQTAI